MTPGDKEAGAAGHAAAAALAALESAVTGFAVLEPDQMFLGANRAYAKLTGRRRAGLLGTAHGDVVHPDDRPWVHRMLESVGGGAGFTSIDTRYVRPDDVIAPVRVVASACAFDAAPRILLQAFGSESLPGSDEVFRQVFELAPVGQATIALDGTLMHINRTAADLVGSNQAELVGRRFVEALDPSSIDRASEAFRGLVRGERRAVRLDVRLVVRADGTFVYAEAFASPVLDAAGAPMYFVTLVQDVTERRHREQQIWHLAVHDALTELPNRAWFLERLGQAGARGRREESRLAVFFLDLDGFKEVNDTLGHESGDQVLFAAAGRMSRVLRPGDTLARYGGDEFTILCEDIPGVDEVREIAERILTVLFEPFRVGGGLAHVAASIGVALADAGTHSPPALLEAADAAMYAGKQAGGGTYRIREL